jgi:hypothetical protein
VYDGEDADSDHHGGCFEAVEVGFVGGDGPFGAGGEFDEAEDDSDLELLVALYGKWVGLCWY